MNTNHLSPSLLTWLRCFDAVARHNSFTLAAKELHVTQGSVSQQVKKLEEYLGVPLFYREGKSLSLTREGHGCHWSPSSRSRR
jgi:DNA-binding transcriptional LysR family regulator